MLKHPFLILCLCLILPASLFATQQQSEGTFRFEQNGKEISDILVDSTQPSGTIDVHNVGNGDISRMSITMDKGLKSLITQNTCKNTLAANTSCQLTYQLNNSLQINQPYLLNVSGNNVTNNQMLFAVYIAKSGQINCWGTNSLGQLGNGDSSISKSSIPLSVKNINNAVKISTGTNHTCALLDSGRMQCWGDNTYGELGRDPSSTPSSNTPLRVPGINQKNQVVDIATGANDTCILTTAGTISCWGNNNSNQLGMDNDTILSTYQPVAVKYLASKAIAVFAGATFNTCALLDTGRIQCWGYNGSGNLGDGNIKVSNVPTYVKTNKQARQVNLALDHSCATMMDNSMSCWGDNSDGQLGDDKPGNNSLVPVNVKQPLLTNIKTLSTAIGDEYSCELVSYQDAAANKTNQAAYCWGNNQQGTLGNGTISNSSIPVKVSLSASPISLAGNAAHSCTILKNGKTISMNCWGGNYMGQIGNGDYANYVATPASVLGSLDKPIAATANSQITCALY